MWNWLIKIQNWLKNSTKPSQTEDELLEVQKNTDRCHLLWKF